MIAEAAGQHDMLLAICCAVEEQISDAVCTILLLDTDGIHVRHGANRRLPASFISAVDGLPIGPTAGSCGTAMFRREVVLTPDIAHDPLWKDYRELAAKHGLAACASFPIFSRHHELVLGSFAIYHTEPRIFTPGEIDVMESFIGLASIVIENCRREERLKLFEALVQIAHDSVVITDAQLQAPGPRIMFVNPAFTKMTGYLASEVVGKTPRILQGPKTDAKTLARLRQNLQAGQAFSGETINYRKDGSEFILEWYIDCIRDEAGRVTNYIAVQRDVTEKRQHEAEQARRLRNKEEGIVVVSHELRTPLTAINAYTALLRRTITTMEQCLTVQKLVKGLEDSTKRMARLTTELLQEGTIESRYLTVRLENANANELLTSISEIFTLDAKKKSILLKLDIAHDCPAVQCDHDLLIEVLSNLVDNALKFTDVHGTITIGAAACGPTLKFWVQDTGPGIKQDQLTHLFEKYWHGSDDSKAIHGLGLYIAKGLTEAQGGKIWAECPTQGGTRFNITLPAAAMPAA